MLGLPAAHIAQLAGRQLARREWLALAESAQPAHLSLQPQPSPPPPPLVQERGGADALEEELERVRRERAAARSAAVASQRQVQHESQRVAQLLLTIERLEESERAREAGEPNGRPRDKHTPRPTDQKRPARPCWTEIRRLAAQERQKISH